MDTKYNGWKNYATWNVAMALNGGWGEDHTTNKDVLRFIRISGPRCTYTAFERVMARWRGFDATTPDGVKYCHRRLDRKALTCVLREIWQGENSI